jgi:hypothetical protein
MLAGSAVMLGLFATGWVLAWQGFDPMIGQATRFRPYYLLGFEPIVWGLAASLVAGVGVSLATSPPPRALVRRLFEVLPDPHEVGVEIPNRVFSSKLSSELQRIVDAPTSTAQLRQKLGRTGLLDASKVTLVRALPDEVPKVPGTTFLGWVTEQGGRLVTDRRGRVTIKLTDDALVSLKSAVETVGHELYHIGEMLAGSGASEKAAEDAAKEFLERFVQRLGRLN